MSELEEAWALALAEAERRARAGGRSDVAEYLALRHSNDLLRTIGIDWLITSFKTAASDANRLGGSIQTSEQDGHRFRIANATMVGKLLTLRSGVRTLLVEAGWPRTPRDGIVRGGGLACANIRHLGIKAANQELQLVRSKSGGPRWVVFEKTGGWTEVHEAAAKRHIGILLP